MKLNAAIVIKTKNGYAVCPFSGNVPHDIVLDMEVATQMDSYSYATDTVLAALKRHFEPKDDPTPAPITPAVVATAPMSEEVPQ